MLYSGRKADPVAKTWQDLPRFWEAQARCADEIPLTAMVVTTDIPEDLADIHPPYKWVVGGRLARLALNKTYGRTEIRFGWDETAQPNLVNSEGLPALPFRRKVSLGR